MVSKGSWTVQLPEIVLTNPDLDFSAVEHCQVIDHIQHASCHLQHPVNRPAHAAFS